MKFHQRKLGIFLALVVVCVGGPARAQSLASPGTAGSTNRYQYNTRHDPDGIGKFYLGREIAQVMGHEAADWLERPEREREENSARLVQALDLRPGQVVADIGAGTGYYSRRMATKVGPTGKVLAVDIQPEMLELLKSNAARGGITNIQTILGAESDPQLPPRSVDLVLLVDVYHEFAFPYEMLEGIVKALKPGGRVAFVEYRAEDPRVPIKPLHKMFEAQVRREAQVQGLVWTHTYRGLPWQHLIVFKLPEKPAEARSKSS